MRIPRSNIEEPTQGRGHLSRSKNKIQGKQQALKEDKEDNNDSEEEEENDNDDNDWSNRLRKRVKFT